MEYEIKRVVCDWGIYKDNKLVYVCNSHVNANIILGILLNLAETTKMSELLIAQVLEKDVRETRVEVDDG